MPSGQVIRTEPASGTEVARDSTVTVVVSKGTDVVLVPNLVGSTIDAATAAAEAKGLTVTVAGAYKPGAKVKATTPAAGIPVRQGFVVILTF